MQNKCSILLFTFYFLLFIYLLLLFYYFKVDVMSVGWKIALQFKIYKKLRN